MNEKYQRSFQLYSKNKRDVDSDNIFSVIGKKEPDLTKSIAALLFHDEKFLKMFLRMIIPKAKLSGKHVNIYAEQPSIDLTKKRDITIEIIKARTSKTIVIEAKSPTLKISNKIPIISQLNEYFNPKYYPDIIKSTNKIGVTLTNERIITSTEKLNFDVFKSITWEDLITEMDNNNFENEITKYFKNELIKIGIMKTYEDEIISPCADDTIDLIEDLNIYCCNFDRKLKKAIYLMPRISFSKLKDRIKDDKVRNNKKFEGKGFALSLYKIKDTFVTDKNSLHLIQDEELRVKVNKWLDRHNEKTLKVISLDREMPFAVPKVTKGQHMNYTAYYEFREIWDDRIPRKQDIDSDSKN